MSKWIKVLVTYFLGQGATQIIQMLTGFLVINYLTKDAYATFALVIAFQSTTNILVELGITRTLIPLIGRRVDDQEVVGRYIAACRFFRNFTLTAGSTILLIVFYFSAKKYGWSFGYWILLWLTVVLTLLGHTVNSIFNSIFLLREDIKSIYKISLSAGVIRLALVALTHFTVGLNALLALTFVSVQALIDGYAKKFLTKNAFIEPGKDRNLASEKREILGQSLPRVPSVAFFALEGQIMILIMGLIGTTSQLGELGALGRIGMLFIIFNRMGNVLIGPYFAKCELKQVLPHTLTVISATAVLGIFSLGFVYLFPQALLVLLGDGYQHLQHEVLLVVCASVLRFIDITSFAICLSRKYIYSWFSAVDIIPLVIVIIIALAFFDLSNVRSMLYFGLAMALVKLATKFFILWVGMRRELSEPKTA